MTFDGRTYDEAKDEGRLGAQLEAVRHLMLDGVWRSLAEIEGLLGYPQASISARLRDLRKPKFGGLCVFRRRRTEGTNEYRVADARQKAQCPRCGAWLEDEGGLGVLAHLNPPHEDGCGYCVHERYEHGKCTACGKLEEPKQCELALRTDEEAIHGQA